MFVVCRLCGFDQFSIMYVAIVHFVRSSLACPHDYDTSWSYSLTIHPDHPDFKNLLREHVMSPPYVSFQALVPGSVWYSGTHNKGIVAHPAKCVSLSLSLSLSLCCILPIFDGHVHTEKQKHEDDSPTPKINLEINMMMKMTMRWWWWWWSSSSSSSYPQKNVVLFHRFAPHLPDGAGPGATVIVVVRGSWSSTPRISRSSRSCRNNSPRPGGSYMNISYLVGKWTMMGLKWLSCLTMVDNGIIMVNIG